MQLSCEECSTSGSFSASFDFELNNDPLGQALHFPPKPDEDRVQGGMLDKVLSKASVKLETATGIDAKMNLRALIKGGGSVKWPGLIKGTPLPKGVDPTPTLGKKVLKETDFPLFNVSRPAGPAHRVVTDPGAPPRLALWPSACGWVGACR